MAESLALIGLAANIISFVEIAYKVVAEANNLYDAHQSSTAEIREVDLIVKVVQEHNANRLRENINGVKLSQDEKDVLAMVKECERLAEELKEIIGTLKVREGRWRTVESGRVALMSRWKRKDVQGLQRRLEIFDQRIRTSVSHALQK
jgi:hypothetical protein